MSSSIVRHATEVVHARRDHIAAVQTKNTRREDAAAAAMEIALENLDHAVSSVWHAYDDTDGLNVAPFERRFEDCMAAKPSKGQLTPAAIDALIDCACDVPELLHEIDRLRAEISIWERGQ